MSDTARKLGVFPAFHKVAGRRVVIVGGGAEAAAKIRLLSETRAEIVVFAASLDRETGADLIAAHGDWRGAFPALADLAGAALVFAATGSEESDREVCALAREAGVPVNVRRPAGALRLLHAGAGQPGAAGDRHRQRGRRAGAHPPACAPASRRCWRRRFGDLAALAEKLRGRVGAALASFGDRRRYWARFFSGPVAEKVFAGRIAEAEDRGAAGARDRPHPLRPRVAGRRRAGGGGPADAARPARPAGGRRHRLRPAGARGDRGAGPPRRPPHLRRQGQGRPFGQPGRDQPR